MLIKACLFHLCVIVTGVEAEEDEAKEGEEEEVEEAEEEVEMEAEEVEVEEEEEEVEVEVEEGSAARRGEERNDKVKSIGLFLHAHVFDQCA